MPAQIIDGKKLAGSILSRAKERVSKLGVKPCLAVVLVGKNPASELYVEKKQAACREVGIESRLVSLDEGISERELLEKVKELNGDSAVHGILVQLPLPASIDRNNVLCAIAPEKDVDGFSPENMGKLALGVEEMVSCTASGIVKLIESTGASLEGKECCIVNHSIVVGRPLAQLLLNRNATVAVCHKFTKGLAEHTKRADVLVAAVGKPGLITADMVKKGAIVIDAGIAYKGGKVLGDVDFEKVKEVASAITPVPGGVGPMTVACLIENTVRAAEAQR